MESAKARTNYAFTIHNRSGGPQSYSLFNHPPDISPQPENLVSHALLVARGVPSTAGIATLVIRADGFYAICGTMYQDDAAQMYVLDRQPVSLGSRPHGAAGKSSGTTVVLGVASGSPFFASWMGPGRDFGKEGAFCLQTQEFKLVDAKNNGYVAAFGLKTSPNAHVGIHASFTPAPNTMYQITPSKIYYLVPMAFAPNEPRPADMDCSQILPVDLAATRPQVVVVHENGTLSLVTESSLSPPTAKL
ncbi:hypothetical protein E4U41_006777 [Claviceps citrina]|nr:hypothetical protein E4U41_006777 [Claviceps citrina]